MVWRREREINDYFFCPKVEAMNMNIRIFFIAVTFVLTATSLTLASPSFDCSKAASEVEQLICRDQLLAKLDQELSIVFARALENIPEAVHATTRAMQRGWIKGRNDCWKAEDVRSCVEASYQTRLVELQIAGGLLEAPDYHLFVCNQNDRKPFTAVFYNQTVPRSAVLTWGDDQVIAFITPAASGARYSAPGVEFWAHQGEVTGDWYGDRLHCQSSGDQSRSIPVDSPSVDELRNATYRGFDGVAGSITLQDGRWQGEPYVEGGATLPQAQMVGDLMVSGDLNSDGSEEAVVLINYAPGGTAEFLYLAVCKEQNGSLENIATTLVGDRPRVRNLALQGDRIVLDLVQAGANDPSCCPGDVVIRHWVLNQRLLDEQDSGQVMRRLSPELLQDQIWRLRRWRNEEPVASTVNITLSYKEGRLIGSSGCNNYFANATSGEMPGDITLTGVGSTRRVCADPALSAAEQRFLELLPRVRHLSWAAGKLTLSYGQGKNWGVMFFEDAPDTNMQ
jgi:uncharacterized protein/heat shock protein HslJ